MINSLKTNFCKSLIFDECQLQFLSENANFHMCSIISNFAPEVEINRFEQQATEKPFTFISTSRKLKTNQNKRIFK